MAWYRIAKQKLEASGIFKEVLIVGAKIRAVVSETLFLEIYYDPTTKSYSYGLVDLTLPYPGDKRIFGWDDYPHEGVKEMKRLKSYPHHFQRRDKEKWVFEESLMRGNVEKEIDIIIKAVSKYLK
ncbi:MAG: DUF6516 family protein [Candidatus Hydrothermarchaeota archaeon]|nr:DUF6516 family protein [Candidatus Hydrothermarchaeota archaeon]